MESRKRGREKVKTGKEGESKERKGRKGGREVGGTQKRKKRRREGEIKEWKLEREGGKNVRDGVNKEWDGG